MLQEKIRSYEERLQQAEIRDKTVSQKFDVLSNSLEELKKKTVPPSPAIEAKLAEVLHLTTRISELSEEVNYHIHFI